MKDLKAYQEENLINPYTGPDCEDHVLINLEQALDYFHCHDLQNRLIWRPFGYQNNQILNHKFIRQGLHTTGLSVEVDTLM